MKNISIVILFIATLGFVLFLSNNRYNDNVSIISNLEAKVVALTEENIMLDDNITIKNSELEKLQNENDNLRSQIKESVVLHSCIHRELYQVVDLLESKNEEHAFYSEDLNRNLVLVEEIPFVVEDSTFKLIPVSNALYETLNVNDTLLGTYKKYSTLPNDEENNNLYMKDVRNTITEDSNLESLELVTITNTNDFLAQFEEYENQIGVYCTKVE